MLTRQYPHNGTNGTSQLDEDDAYSIEKRSMGGAKYDVGQPGAGGRANTGPIVRYYCSDTTTPRALGASHFGICRSKQAR